MRPRVRLLLTLALTVLLGAGHADADLFDTARRAVRTDLGQADTTGVTVRGGASLQTGLVPGTTTLLQGHATSGGACAFDFGASLKQGFEELPAVFEALVGEVLQGLPMLVLCYTSPTLCDLAKHWQALVNATLQARYAQCQQVQAAMAYAGLRLRGGQTAQCLEEAVTAGAPLSTAMQRCQTEVRTLRTPAGLQAGQMDLVRETLAAAAVSPEVQALARQLLGEVTFTATGPGLGSAQQRPATALLQRYEAHRQGVERDLRDAVSMLAATGTVPDALLRALSVPGQPMPRVALEALAAMQQDPVRSDALLQKLATGLALTRLTWDVHELHAQLAAAEGVNTQLTDEQRRLLQQRLDAVQRDLAQVMQKKETIERHLHPALDALLAEYVAIQQVATQAGLAAPSAAPPRLPFQGQTPAGYGH